MKKFILWMLCTMMLIGALCPVYSFAKEDDLDALWKEREKADAVEFAEPQRDSEESTYKQAFRRAADNIGVLLYTRAAKDWTVKRVYLDENVWYEKDYYFTECTPRTISRHPEGYEATTYMYVPELLPVLAKCYASYEGEENVYGYKILPALRAAINEYRLTKEEIVKACEASRKDPDAVRSFFSDFSDEEFEKMKAEGELSFDLDRSWLLDALFVKNDEDCALLCITPLATVVDGVLVRQSYLYYQEYTPEMLSSASLSRLEIKSFEALLRNAKNYVPHSDNYDPIDDREKTLAYLDRFDAVLNAATPQTGEHTNLYVVSGVSALALAVAIVIYLCIPDRKRLVD